VTKLENKPFALIGVNSWTHEPGELKQAMTKEQINWRSFDDSGAINAQWNSPYTPAYYLMDHKGIIRGKWAGKPSEKSIDAVLEKLIQEAERAAD
jgi:hypothetical protein